MKRLSSCRRRRRLAGIAPGDFEAATHIHSSLIEFLKGLPAEPVHMKAEPS